MESIIRQETKKLLSMIKELVVLTIGQHQEVEKAIDNHDRNLALEVLDGDNIVDTKYDDIKSEIEFIITKIPLGKELRRTLSYLLVVKEIERIADYAKHIAKFVIKQEDMDKSSIKRIQDIHKPFMKMLIGINKVLESENVEEATKLALMDKDVDFQKNKIRKDIIESVSKKTSKTSIEQRLFVLNIINSIERAADHIVNVCEQVIYIKTGSHSSLAI